MVMLASVVGVGEEALGAMINLTGKMRMLSHRVVLGISLALPVDGAEPRTEFRQMAETALDEFDGIASALLHGNRSLGVPPNFSDRVSALLGSEGSGHCHMIDDFQGSARSVLADLGSGRVDTRDDLLSLSGLVANELLETLDRLVGAISQDLREAVEEAQSRSRAANQMVADAAAEISDIGSQVEMIALNALIEASQAGEHGRGFTVIALKVKELAKRTKSSARQIADSSKSLSRGT